MKYVSAEPSPADHRQTEITRQSSSSWYSLVIVKKTHQSSGDSADFRPWSTVMIQLSHCHHHLHTYIHNTHTTFCAYHTTILNSINQLFLISSVNRLHTTTAWSNSL